MKTILILTALVVLTSCGGGGGSSKKAPATPVYSIEYLYPENPLFPGQGSIEVDPVGAICKDSSGNAVDDELCPDLADFDPTTAPKHPYESPAGFITVNIENSLEGDIQVPVESGIDWSNIEDTIRRNKLQSLVTCSSGYTQNFRGDCVVQGFSYTYGQWPANSLAPCSGSQVFTRTYICIDDVSGISVDYSFCSDYGITPDTNRTYLSPVGNGTMTGANGDSLNISCQEGKTQHDLGLGTMVTSVASCGTQRHLASPSDLTCTPNSYVASDIQYPVNDMAIGTGSRTVTATGFNECRTSHDNSLVALSYCSDIVLSSLTEVQLSPAGSVTETTPEGDSLTYTYTEGGTKASPETVIVVNSCGDERNSSGDSCVENTYTPSGFIFPANDMEVGEGTKTVNAEGFSVCTRDHDSSPVIVSMCSMPSVIPTETQLSPAGDYLIPVENSVGGGVIISLAEGQTLSDLPEGDVSAHLDTNLVCESGYNKDNGTCSTSFNRIIPMDSFMTCSVNNSGSLLCAGTSKRGEYGTGTNSLVKSTPFLTGFSDVVSFQGNQVESVDPFGGTSDNMGAIYAMNSLGEIYRSGSNMATAVGSNRPTLVASGAKDFSYGLMYNFAGVAVKFCYINSSDDVRCAGSNLDGGLGTGSKASNSVPLSERATLFSKSKKIYAGSQDVCVITLDDDIECAGQNGYGYFGRGNTTQVSTPVKLTQFGKVKQLSLGRYLHSIGAICAINMDDNVMCAGREESGMFGLNRSATATFTSVQATGFPKAKSLSANGTGVCIVSFENKLVCAGANTFGRFGSGTTSNYLVPTVITQWGDIKSVAISETNLCVEKIDGTKSCAGYNQQNQLGNGNKTNSSIPVVWND